MSDSTVSRTTNVEAFVRTMIAEAEDNQAETIRRGERFLQDQGATVTAAMPSWATEVEVFPSPFDEPDSMPISFLLNTETAHVSADAMFKGGVITFTNPGAVHFVMDSDVGRGTPSEIQALASRIVQDVSAIARALAGGVSKDVRPLVWRRHPGLHGQTGVGYGADTKVWFTPSRARDVVAQLMAGLAIADNAPTTYAPDDV